MLSVWAPGKLMVLGEYAVTQVGRPGLVMAINRGLTCTIHPSSLYQMAFPGYFAGTLTGVRLADLEELLRLEPRLGLVAAILRLVRRYLGEEEAFLAPFALTVASDLQDVDGVKLGLGSSAALACALMAVLLAHGRNSEVMATREEVFKLAALAYVEEHPLASCADIAAAAYGGLLRYERFDGAALQSGERQGTPLHNMITSCWPALRIERLPEPDLQMRVGWTGKPASTPELLRGMAAFQKEHPTAFFKFLEESEGAVKGFSAAVTAGRQDEALAAVTQNRRALRQLAQGAGMAIETPRMTEALDRVAELGGSGKSSGAGGGDVIMAWFKTDKMDGELFREWGKMGVKALPLSPANAGITQTRQ